MGLILRKEYEPNTLKAISILQNKSKLNVENDGYTGPSFWHIFTIKQLDDNLFQSFIKLTHHGAKLNTLSQLGYQNVITWQI